MYNTINSLVSQAIEPTDNFAQQSKHGFSDAEIAKFVQDNIGNPQAIANAAQQYGISPMEISRATGYSPTDISNYFSNAGINFGATPQVSAPQVGNVSDQQIREFLAANPTPQQLTSAMQQYGVTPEQVFNAAGVGQGGTLNVGGTYFQPEYQTTGSGEDQQIGPLQNIYSYTQDQNKVGGTYNQYDAQGNLVRQGTQQKVSNSLTPFVLGSLGLFGGLGGGLESLLGGGAEAVGATGAAGAGTIANTGMTLGELAQLDLALGGAGGTAGALEMASTIGGTGAAAAAAQAITSGGSTSLANIGANNAFEAANAGASAMTDLGASQLANAGASALTPTAAVASIPAATTALGGAEVAATQTIANTGMTLGQLAQLDVALGGAGGTAGALEMASTIGGPVAAAAAATAANSLGGTTSLANIGANNAFEAANAGSSAMTDLGASELTNAGAGALTPSVAANTLGATELGAGALGTTAATTGTGLTAGGTGLTTGAGLGANTTLGSTLGSTLGADTALASGLGAGSAMGTGLTSGSLSGLTTGTAGLGANGLGAGLAAGAGGLTAANSLLGGSTLGSALGNTMTGVLGATTGSALGTAAGSALGSGAASALGTTVGQGLGLNALGNVAGSIANQQAISQARDLINQYGERAGTALANAYQNAQGLNTANRTDLGNLYQNTSGNLQNLYNQQVGYQAPYQQVGQSGTQGLIANQPYFTHQFDVNDLNTNLAPNYAFMLGQGQMANQRAANAGGGALGGNAMQGLQRYTQDYAGNAYQQAFNNYNTQRNNIYNSLAGMANIGQTSTGQLANLGNTYGSNMAGLSNNYGGNLTTNAGQGIGAANAYGLNQANLATGIGSALAGNAVAGGANTANALSSLGNTALLGSMIKAT